MNTSNDLFSASFGRVRVIPGENNNRFPYSVSVFIDDDVKAIIDTGAGKKRLKALKKSCGIDAVYNTHYHYDHINGNHLFDEAEIYLNDKEAGCFRDRKILGAYLGMEEVYGRDWIEGWIERIKNPETPPSPHSPLNSHNWWLSTSRISGEYKWGDVISFGKTSMHVIAAPGHSGGFCCMHFPDQDVLYAADIDLGDFGPWYGGTDGDIDLFIDSCRRVKQIGAGHIITGHEKGILTAAQFKAGLVGYLGMIDERDSRIVKALKNKPATIRDIAAQGHIYGRKFHVDEFIFMWEMIMVKKHIERLVKNGVAGIEGKTVFVL
jgi:hydroxyacylglutathione hydrolase